MSTTTKPADFTAMSRLSADIDLLADGKAAGFVRVPHSVHRSAYGWIPIPIVRIKNGDGPSVLMQAGTHGDEWEGQIGLGNLLRALEPKDIKGRLVILPSANFPAAMAGQRTSPIDEGNLNRLYPGDAEGTITQQIAYWIEHALLPGFDYSFDFHSGGSSLTYIPSALAPRHEDPARMQKIVGMLKAFGAPVSYIAAAPQGGGRTFTSASARQGVVSMGTELGGGGLVTPASLKVAEDGMRRVLAHVGLLQGPVPAASPTRLTEIGGDDYYVYASDGGLFEPLVDLGAEVKAGQPAARIHFHHTPWREPDLLTFKRDGLVLCKRVPARCERGDCLFHLATDIGG
ncbi:MAG TPA: succinylglutamate desuccinylase/aspartoacylase family protein [Reyranella sp.]|nr:succinylglutamate desuccinylase/aspartoacylase family protein [Reyranella sp.]